MHNALHVRRAVKESILELDGCCQETGTDSAIAETADVIIIVIFVGPNSIQRGTSQGLHQPTVDLVLMLTLARFYFKPVLAKCIGATLKQTNAVDIIMPTYPHHHQRTNANSQHDFLTVSCSFHLNVQCTCCSYREMREFVAIIQ